MALFFLTYDLRKKRDYQKLYDELEKFKAVEFWSSRGVSKELTRLLQV